jgi:predicted GIY-YIG superfamily endonuclease
VSEFSQHQRVRHTRNPGWGVGEILDTHHPSGLSAFFEWVGERYTLKEEDLVEALDHELTSPILDAVRIHGLSQANHSVYVVELDTRVLNHYSFRQANPVYTPGNPCVYVGLTGLEVEKRFENHKRGYQSNYFVSRYGERLLYSLFQELNPRRYEIAHATEFELARKLRLEGYGVWQN